MMNDYSKQRRVVRHGAMTPGCSFWAPIALNGDGARQNKMPAEPAQAVSHKLPQAMAQYQNVARRGERCTDCVRYQADELACQRVDGEIAAGAWCVLWTAKAAHA